MFRIIKKLVIFVFLSVVVLALLRTAYQKYYSNILIEELPMEPQRIVSLIDKLEKETKGVVEVINRKINKDTLKQLKTDLQEKLHREETGIKTKSEIKTSNDNTIDVIIIVDKSLEALTILREE